MSNIYGARGVNGRLSNDTAYFQFICNIFSIKRFFLYIIFIIQCMLVKDPLTYKTLIHQMVKTPLHQTTCPF